MAIENMNMREFSEFLEKISKKINDYVTQLEDDIAGKLEGNHRFFAARTAVMNATALVLANLFGRYVCPFTQEKTNEAVDGFYKRLQAFLQEELSKASGKTAYSMELPEAGLKDKGEVDP